MRMERASYGQMANVAKHRERRLRELRQVFHGCWALKVRAWTLSPLAPRNLSWLTSEPKLLNGQISLPNRVPRVELRMYRSGAEYQNHPNDPLPGIP